jgi:O-antigen ligase
VGGSGITLPIGIALEAIVWFPADLFALTVLWVHRDQLFPLALRNALLLTWPLLAMTSTIWSINPGLSFYHGVQLLMTVAVGMMLTLHADLLRILQFSFVAMLVVGFICLLLVYMTPADAAWPTGEWVGAYRHKNTLGNAMAAQIITGVCLLLQGWRPLLTGSGIAFAAWLMLMSRSSAAIVTLVTTLSLLVFVFVYRRGYIALLFAVGLVIFIAGAGLLISDLMQANLYDSILEHLGKDSSLTGRTVLWDFGIDAFSERPWLGFGYKGWWTGEGTEAPILRMVAQQELSMFHNNFIEVAVAFGVWGPIALVSVIVFAFWISVRMFLIDPQYIRAWPLLYLVFVLIQCMVENPLFNNHGLNEAILIAVCSVGIPRKTP